MCLPQLKTSLLQWSGKHTDDLLHSYNLYCSKPKFAKTLVSYLTDSTLEQQASWLLKHYLINQHSISLVQQNGILIALKEVKHWLAKLHILQCFEHFCFSEPVDDIWPLLRHLISDKNKFIRAWSYSAMYYASLNHPLLHNEFKELVTLALTDESPSVKARLRKLNL